jgi:hypothetical protein
LVISREPDLDRRIRRAQRARILANLWDAKWLVPIVIVVLVLLAWLAQPLQYDGLVEGRITSSFIVGASKYRTQSITIDAALRDGQRVSFTLPKTVAYRPDADVEIAAYHSAGPLTRYVSKFRRYISAPN